MNQTYLIPLGYDWLFELIFVIELAARSMTFIYVGPFDLEQEKNGKVWKKKSLLGRLFRDVNKS